MHLSENEGIEGNTFVVTGGLGFVGSALCSDLVRRGAREVRSLDHRSSSPWSDHLAKIGVRCIQGDVCQKKDVERALRGAACVFHLASYGMSGKEMLQAGRVDEVNINGTCHVLDACVMFGIKRLIYVSTYNVVFGGKEIVNGNEALPYFPIDDHVDPYGRSKSIAEQLVLKNNGRQSNNASVKTDWVYVDNLVLALIQASMGLLDDIPGKKGPPVAAGQPYFICDGSPVNTFEFLRPLLRSLKYDLPNTWIDVSLALTFARIFWVLYTLLYPMLHKSWLPQPLILPAEVYKVGVTHYFSYLKAKEELGYVPMVSPQDGMTATIAYWKERKRRSLDGPTIYVWLFALIGMTALFVAAFLPEIGPVKFIKAFALLLFRSGRVLQIVFILALAAHLGEGIYAWQLAKKVDPANSNGWFWQTFALGFFSLRFLLKRAKGNNRNG
ncbi:hypothetical protein Sjap_009665 [Stephania japonica]|uniref:3-beta hydroxysteroid dehydrogenase/isomerase domain-containing protein n=1 Tax=Stephania japonica TaxID=461633 RepID=A0AAP0J838_9MAGN